MPWTGSKAAGLSVTTAEITSEGSMTESTLIASLASLITFREYTQNNPGKTGYYVALFTAFNFGFLLILGLFTFLLS